MTTKPSARTTLPALVAETPLAPQPPTLVVFGRDGASKPRAAWFDATDAEAATAAAETMRLRALPITDELGRDLAGQLARGRMLATGRALVPFVRRDLFARLVTLAGAEAGLSLAGGSTTAPDETPKQPPAIAGAAEAPPPPRPGDRTFVGSPQPSDRAEIGLGSVVLALEAPGEGWWEAEVIGVNGAVFSLRWCDYPTQPTLLRKATELALLPAGAA
jgi:hypothetical protein